MSRPALLASIVFLSLVLLSTIAPAQTPGPTVGEEGRIVPEVTVQSKDYASLRKTFRTRLLRHGPAPESDSLPPLPEGAMALPYHSGGQRLMAWIDRPASPGKGRWPAVLFLHGGFSFGPLDWKMTRAFHDSGFVVMTPTFRGENRQGGDFTLFYDEVDDVLAAARELARQPYV
ncbi:MAG TPA: S9 family peptidase, partial [Candidatus Polarisedimenticolia bacterium]|nr:S9 family peptidase [Candidatus Polarisedimenticolia bacterium]